MILTVGAHNFVNQIAAHESYFPFITDISDRDRLFSLALSVDPAEVPSEKPIGHFTDENGNTTVYETGDRYLIACSDSGASPFSLLSCDKEFHRADLTLLDSTHSRQATDNALMMLYAFASARHQTLLMHSSVVVHQGKGYLFLGKSGTGKSTHSNLWLNHVEETRLLNDDNPVVRIIDGRCWVYGSPWSGKTPCYRNESYPVGGIVRLWQSPRNHIRRLRPLEALAALLPTASTLPCVRTVQQGVLNTVTQVVESVPIYSLECLPDEAAARLCAQTLVNG